MIHRPVACVFLLALILTPVVGLNSPNDSERIYEEGAIVIKLSRTCTPADAARIAAALGATVKYRFELFEAEYWHINVSVTDAIERFGSDPRVEYIEPNYRIHLDATYPDDPLFDQLWGMYNRGEVRGLSDADIDATDAWDIETGGDVIVGVCDSGVDYDHEDLAANIYTNPNEIPDNGIDDDNNGYVDDVRGWDFGDDDNDPMDEVGHGSHVAGTIAAVGNNGVGVTGVNWSAKIMPLKIVDKDGGGFTYPAARAIEYAVMMGARVTNHSWGGGNPSTVLNEAIVAAQDAGVLTVASAGNAGVELNDLHQHFPAGLPYDGIIAVANTTRDDRLAGSSNWSAVNVDLGAPGSGVLSTIPDNQYDSYTGTSMSAPHVTGAVSLIWAHAPHLTHMEVKQLLLTTVDPLPDLLDRSVSGGRLNIHTALAALDDEAPSAVTDLAGSLAGPTTASLVWTAAGDDGATGTAKRYEVRYSRQPIDEANFDSAAWVLDPPVPNPAGTVETYSMPDLRYGTTYHFALRVHDAHGNVSPVSNTATVTTLIADPPPRIAVSPTSLVKTLMTGGQATKSFSITNSGTGDLEWTIDMIDGGYVPGVVTAEGESPVLKRPFDLGEVNEAPPVGTTEGFLHGVRIVFDASRGRVQDRWNGIIDDLLERGATVIVDANPLIPEVFDSTDVLWLTDALPPASITSEEIGAIAAWVRGGGGLLLEGDDDITGELFNRILVGMNAGIEYSDDDGEPGVTTHVYPHETTDDVVSVIFEQNGSHLSRVTAPAQLLMEDPNGVAAAAAVEIGSGRVVAMTDELSDDAHIGREDNRRFANRVFGWLAGTFWAAPGPIAGTVLPGQSADVDVVFDAKGLAGGIYQAGVRVDSNDPASPYTPVTATLGVTAAPDIAVSHDSIDYGVVFTTVTDTETLAVHNGGKETLTVHDVGVSGADFSVDVTTFVLAPDEGREIVVSVSPSVVGNITGTLSITSNDPDDALIMIPLSADAFDPPIITVAPNELNETRYGDETITRTLTITNDGEYNLDFAVVVEDIPSPLSQVPVFTRRFIGEPTFHTTNGELLVGGGDGKNALIPETLNGTAYDNATGLVIFKDDFEDGDFEGWEIQGTGKKEVTDETAAGGTIFSYHEYDSPAGHFDGVIKRFGATQPGYIAFNIRPGAIDEADAYVTLVGSNKRYITYVYCSSGGRLCVNAGNPGEDCSIEYDAEQWYFIELKDIDFGTQTFDYYVDRVPIAEQVPFMAPTDDIAGMMLYNYWGGGRGWWDEIVVATEHIVTWLTTEPSTGVVAPHSTLDVEVTFDATQLFTGQHQRSIAIRSNDPATPEVEIPASIDVTAVPNIALSDTLLDFGEVVVGLSRALSFKIINRSIQENLVVDDIVVDHPAYSVDPASMTLGPNARKAVEVVFEPDEHGPANGTVTVHSNDRDEPVLVVEITGNGVDAPVLSVLPDSMSIELAAGEVAVDSILITNAVSNPEAADLEFLLWVDDQNPLDWLTLSPQTGTVEPGSTVVVVANFDASELNEGEYPADIRASVNIPNTGWLRAVKTMLRVSGSPEIAVTDSVGFGTAYLGFPIVRTLTVENVGTAALVVSDVTADRPEFTATPSSLTVAPGHSDDIDIVFTPEVLGPVTATLTVTSNDTSTANAEVRLTAQVFGAPSLSLSTDSLWVTVMQTRSRGETITLENAGATDLEWGADLSFVRDLAGLPPAPSIPEATRPIEVSESSLMDVLWHGSHGPVGSALWTVALADIAAAGGTVTENGSPIDDALLQPFDVLWLGDTDIPLTEDESNAVAAWVSAGGCLLIEAKNVTAIQSYQQVLDVMDSHVELRTTPTANGLTGNIAEHEITHGVSVLLLPGPTAFIADATTPAGILVAGPTGFTIAAHATIGKGRVVVVTDWLLSDLAIHSADNRRFSRQVFGWLSGTNWLAIAPLGGTLAPGEREDISLEFDSGELPLDDYELQLDLVTNDPSRPFTGIPLIMHVVPIVSRQVDLSMSTGLNLRSWNVELDAESTTTILSPVIDVVESVQGFDGGGLTFDPSIPPQFNTLTTMDHYHGYWFRLSEPATLSLNGTVFDHRTPVPLAGGYNLIGYFPNEPDSTAHAIETVIGHTDVVLGYDDGGLTFDPTIPPQFNTLQTMQPGFGYWIKMTEPDTLYYPDSPVALVAAVLDDGGRSPSGGDREGGAAQSSDKTPDAVPTREWISVWGDEVRIDNELVAAGTEVSALDQDGVVCGRCVVHHPGQFGLMAVYGDDPDTGVDEGADLGDAITVIVGACMFEGVEWTGMGDVIDFSDVARMSTSTDQLPRYSMLHQNFPNPFNPITTISYDLAANEIVTLVVFDVLGQRVRQLFSGRQPAGRHRVEWDGKDNDGQRVVSGVYFYRLEAGTYTRTRKMVLLK